MPGSTGPDLNTYTIPEVMNTDTFAYWRDATNTAAYKLNKLRIYDSADSASIGVTYTSSGIWSSTLVPTILSGHTFTNLVRFTGGLSASTIYVSAGSTFAAGVVVIGGLSANSIYASAGSTFAAEVVVAGGLSASRLYASTGSTFAAGVVVIGGLSADAVYASTGSTFAANLMVGLNSVGATLGVCGGVLLYQQSPLRFGAANNNYVALKAPSTVGTSLTWTLPATDGGSGQVLCTDSSGVLGWRNAAQDTPAGNNTEIQYNASGGFSASSALTFTAGGLSANAVYASTGSTFAAGVVVAGGLSASRLYASAGSTFAAGVVEQRNV